MGMIPNGFPGYNPDMMNQAAEMMKGMSPE